MLHISPNGECMPGVSGRSLCALHLQQSHIKALLADSGSMFWRRAEQAFQDNIKLMCPTMKPCFVQLLCHDADQREYSSITAMQPAL